MPPIRNLLRLWSALSGSVSIGSPTISTHDLHFRMSQKPLLDALSFSIWKQVKQVVSFKINDDGSIAFPSFPCEIIDPDRLHMARRWSWKEQQRKQNSHSRQMNTHLCS